MTDSVATARPIDTRQGRTMLRRVMQRPVVFSGKHTR